MSRFVLTLDEHNLRGRVRLLNVPWALKDTDGNPVPSSMGLDTKKANRLYHRYFIAAEPFFTMIRTGTNGKPRGSARHRWGLAPFHYEDSVYAEIATAIGLPVAERAPRT